MGDSQGSIMNRNQSNTYEGPIQMESVDDASAFAEIKQHLAPENK